MRVGAPGPGPAAAAAQRAKPPEHAPATTRAASASSPTGAATEGAGPARGVVDKLASGHFNDVAAIRLAINHAGALADAGVSYSPPETSAHPGNGFQKALDAYASIVPVIGLDDVAVDVVETVDVVDVVETVDVVDVVDVVDAPVDINDGDAGEVVDDPGV